MRQVRYCSEERGQLQHHSSADAAAGRLVAIAERVTGAVDRAGLLVDDLARRTAVAATAVLNRRADQLVDLGGCLRRDPPRILDHQAERLGGRVNMENWRARLQFHRELERLGVIEALAAAGASSGATVRLGGRTLEWQ